MTILSDPRRSYEVGWVESSRPTGRGPGRSRWVSKTRPTLRRLASAVPQTRPGRLLLRKEIAMDLTEEELAEFDRDLEAFLARKKLQREADQSFRAKVMEIARETPEW